MIIAPLALLAAFLAPDAARSPGKTRTERDLAETVAALARPLIEGKLVHGLSVGWIDADGNRRTFAAGQYSRDDTRTPDADSLFEVGSVTKVFTGLLLARAVERAELGLDDDLNTILPESYRLPATVPTVRFVDLATHSAGMPEIPDNLTRDPALFIVDYSGYDDDLLQQFTSAFAPSPPARSRYVYSNAGFGLLGWALARNAGMTFEALLKRDITTPLALRSTSIALADGDRKRLVPGHDPNGDPVERTDFGSLVACGGILSSTNDLLELLGAFLSETSPLAGAMRLTREARFHAPTGVGVGLAWHISLDRSTRFHDGQTGGLHGVRCLRPRASHGRRRAGQHARPTGREPRAGHRGCARWEHGAPTRSAHSGSGRARAARSVGRQLPLWTWLRTPGQPSRG